MAAGDGAQLPATVAASRSVEKALDEAAASGALNLSNRKLKEFPRSARNYDLSDLTHADLSRNRLLELPEELCHFISLETLSLYHNALRTLGDGLLNLQALTYLNLSRNLLSSLPGSVFQLPLLRVLIISNNKLSSLPENILRLGQLRQLDVSCNELQRLPVELGQLESLRDLNLRRNQLSSLPEELSELPLVRLDVSCNRISHVPLCYRHLRHLQNIFLDNNPLQMPPAQICFKGKYHIFKYLNMEACRRSQEHLEENLVENLDKQLRPTGFSSCLSEQDLFPGQFSGLDSGFNSVDSGSKRWSGNESTDDFSERSVRMSEVSRQQRNLEEEEPAAINTVIDPQEQKERFVTTHDSAAGSGWSHSCSPFPPTPLASPSPPTPMSSPYPPTPPSPSSPSLEERRRPGTLLLWQERERKQQREQSSLMKQHSSKTGSHMSSTAETGSSSCGGAPESSSSPSGLRQRCVNSDVINWESPTLLLQRSISRTDAPPSPKTSPPAAQAQKPNSFLFRASSRSNVQSTGRVFSVAESGKSESRSTLRSPKDERKDISQLRKILESRLKITLSEDLSEALSNGTVLCQLVNHIRPRSVAIVHIPSPAVPKLSPAKCRLNMENFLAACRKLGVPETEVCVCSDVLLCQLPAVLRCVTALLAVECGGTSGDEDGWSRPALPASSLPSSPSSSPLSTGFLLFYGAAMALLYVLYVSLLS